MIDLKSHNIKPSNEIKEAFKTNTHVIYVSGVGTGKSYIFMEIADTMFKNKKIGYILPKHAIMKNLSYYEDFAVIQDRVDFITYNYFKDREKSIEKFKDYDLICIDECHHLGSDKYGRNIIHAMMNNDTKVLGLTATPTRDDGTNVATYFDKRIDGLSIFEAIQDGLMPQIEYRLCYPEMSDADIKAKFGQNFFAKLELYDSRTALKDCIAKYPRNKVIAFFPNVKELRSHKKLIEELFPHYEIFELYASLNNLDAVMNGVQNADKAIVMSCNMLLEGVHLEEITQICLFRNVHSIVAFQQMIGRICRIGETSIKPVVIDASENAVKLLAQLLHVNEAIRLNGPSRIKSNPERLPVEVGIGGHTKFDVNELLVLMNNTKEAKNAFAERAIAKYISLGGNIEYISLDSLKDDKTTNNWDKFKACCMINGVTPNFVAEKVGMLT